MSSLIPKIFVFVTTGLILTLIPAGEALSASIIKKMIKRIGTPNALSPEYKIILRYIDTDLDHQQHPIKLLNEHKLLADVQMDDHQISPELISDAFNDEMYSQEVSRQYRRSLPNLSENEYVIGEVKNILSPIISEIHLKYPSLPYQTNVFWRRDVADDIAKIAEKMLSIETPKPAFSVTINGPFSVKLKANKKLRLKHVEFEFGEFDLVKLSVLVGGIAWCSQEHVKCIGNSRGKVSDWHETFLGRHFFVEAGGFDLDSTDPIAIPP